MKLFDSIRRAWSRHDEHLAEESLSEHPTTDPALAAEREFEAMGAGGLMASRGDELESPDPE